MRLPIALAVATLAVGVGLAPLPARPSEALAAAATTLDDDCPYLARDEIQTATGAIDFVIVTRHPPDSSLMPGKDSAACLVSAKRGGSFSVNVQCVKPPYVQAVYNQHYEFNRKSVLGVRRDRGDLIRPTRGLGQQAFLAVDHHVRGVKSAKGLGATVVGFRIGVAVVRVMGNVRTSPTVLKARPAPIPRVLKAAHTVESSGALCR